MINKITDSQLQSLLSYYTNNANEPNAELIVSALEELKDLRVEVAARDALESGEEAQS